jgi:hypothetical protein
MLPPQSLSVSANCDSISPQRGAAPTAAARRDGPLCHTAAQRYCVVTAVTSPVRRGPESGADNCGGCRPRDASRTDPALITLSQVTQKSHAVSCSLQSRAAIRRRKTSEVGRNTIKRR